MTDAALVSRACQDEATRLKATPFWSDAFDMDLLKVIPEAADILAPVANIVLEVAGRPDKNGKLNHPTVWNGDRAMVGFACLKGAVGDIVWWPPFYSDDGVRHTVNATLMELARDIWAHNCLIGVNGGRAILDSSDLWPTFETLMGDLRGWGNKPKPKAVITRAKNRVRFRLSRWAASIDALRKVPA